MVHKLKMALFTLFYLFIYCRPLSVTKISKPGITIKVWIPRSCVVFSGLQPWAKTSPFVTQPMLQWVKIMSQQDWFWIYSRMREFEACSRKSSSLTPPPLWAWCVRFKMGLEASALCGSPLARREGAQFCSAFVQQTEAVWNVSFVKKETSPQAFLF